MSLKGPILIKGTSIDRIILLLHGYGSSGQNILSIARHWNLDNTLFIAPNAPLMWEGGGIGYKWFDLSADVINEQVIKKGLNQVRELLSTYIHFLVKQYGISFDKFIIAGFSQGAMLTLDLLVSMPDFLYAIGFSGIYCPILEITQNAEKKKALLVHGTLDTIVPFSFMAQSEQALKKLGINVQIVECDDIGHSINDDGLKTAEEFVKNVSQ